jgi:hypothetical protein
MSEETKFDEVEVNRETALVTYEVYLDETDKAQKMDKIVEIDDNLNRLQAEKAVALAEFNSKAKAMEREISMLIQHCRDGFEQKEEDCTFEYFWDAGYVEFYSCETGAAVHRRDITQEERQLKLFKTQQIVDEKDEAPKEDE